LAKIMAAPMACSARMPISICTLADAPLSAEPITNPTKPAR